MPRLVNQNPKYRKHRAFGQMIVTIGLDPCLFGGSIDYPVYRRPVQAFLVNALIPRLLSRARWFGGARIAAL